MGAMELKVPQSNVNDTTAKLVSWLVADGGQIEVGQAVAVIETSKAAEEVEAPARGFLRIMADVGDQIAVGGLLAVIADTADALPSRPAVRPSAPPAGGEVRATDEARALAAAHGIDLAAIKARGIITRTQVERAIAGSGGAAAPAPAPASVRNAPVSVPAGRAVPLTRVQKAGADAVLRSLRETATTYVLGEADVTAAMAELDRLIDEDGVLLTVTDLAVHQCSRLLRQFPRLNACLAGDDVIEADGVNIGVAVEVDDNLHLAVIAKADGMTLTEIAEVRQEAVFALFKGEPLRNTAPATFAVTVLDQRGLTHQIPIVFPGNGAIAGFGPVRDGVRFDAEGRPVCRRILGITVSYDHRFITGAQAAKFLSALVASLEVGVFS